MGCGCEQGWIDAGREEEQKRSRETMQKRVGKQRVFIYVKLY